MRRSFAALLAVLAAVSVLAGCGTKKPGGTKTSDDGYTAEYVPEISRGDYNGASVTVMCRDPEMAWGEMAVISDEQSTAVLGDAAYRRNKRLENDYNVKLNFVTYNDETASGGSFYRTISDNLSAYDDICDICIPGIMDAATLASVGAFVDLSSGDVPHLDLEKPWWNKTLNDSMRILNRQYFAISDALLNDKLDTYVMFFNKTLFADSKLDAPYTLVDSGEWTIDAFAKIVKSYGSDLNGNGTPDYEDAYGLVGMIYDVFYVGSGVTGAYLDEKTGLPAITPFSDKTDNIYGKVRDIVSGSRYNTYSIGQEPLFNNDINDTFRAAFDEKSLFMCGPLSFYFNIITEMTSDVGLLPCPKYDENQKEYRHRAGYTGSTAITVLTSVRDRERAGVMLEAFCAGAKNYVSPAFYDTLLTNRYAQDEESKRMISLVIDTEIFDLDQIFKWGTILERLQLSLSSGAGSVATLYARYAAAAEAKLRETIDSYSQLK